MHEPGMGLGGLCPLEIRGRGIPESSSHHNLQGIWNKSRGLVQDRAADDPYYC